MGGERHRGTGRRGWDRWCASWGGLGECVVFVCVCVWLKAPRALEHPPVLGRLARLLFWRLCRRSSRIGGGGFEGGSISVRSGRLSGTGRGIGRAHITPACTCPLLWLQRGSWCTGAACSLSSFVFSFFFLLAHPISFLSSLLCYTSLPCLRCGSLRTAVRRGCLLYCLPRHAWLCTSASSCLLSLSVTVVFCLW